MNYQHWGRLKQLTFLLDAQPEQRGPSLRPAGPDGMHFMDGGETSPEFHELHELVYELKLVAPEHHSEQLRLEDISRIDELDYANVCRNINAIYRGDRFCEGLIADEINSGRVQKLCRRAYRLMLNDHGWPRQFPTDSSGRISEGLIVRSLTNRLEGRTMGGRYECPSASCEGWLISVLWESGQRLHICSEGWHYDPTKLEVQVVGGGEISARFVTPLPLGTPPLPKDQWISREELMHHPAWAR